MFYHSWQDLQIAIIVIIKHITPKETNKFVNIKSAILSVVINTPISNHAIIITIIVNNSNIKHRPLCK